MAKPDKYGRIPVLDEHGNHATDKDGHPLFHVRSSLGVAVESLQEVNATSTSPIESWRKRLVRFVQVAKRPVVTLGRPRDGFEPHHRHGDIVAFGAAPVLALASVFVVLSSRRRLRRRLR